MRLSSSSVTHGVNSYYSVTALESLNYISHSEPPTLEPYIQRLYFDQHLIHYLRQLMVGDGAGFGPVQQRLATLPIKYGGFGVYTMCDTGKYCYLASYAQN